MNKIKEYLQRYLDGKASPKERQELMRIYDEGKLDDSILNEAIKEILKEESSEDISPGNAKEMLAYILSYEKQNEIIPIRRKWNWAWAATVSVLVVASIGIWSIYGISRLPKQTVSKDASEDKLFSFTDQQNKYIHLPDGSTVILNKGSELSYWGSYGEGLREVTLTGEAFFEVKADPDKPFVVHSGNVKTKVLGTAFNVKAYAQQDEVIVTVTKGKVEVYGDERALGVITPDQQLAVNTATRQFIKAEVNAVAALEWTSRFLILDHVTLEEAAAIIADRYNVKITLANEALKKCRVMATFLNEESLVHVLTVVSTINQTKYLINEDGSVVIDGKGCNEN